MHFEFILVITFCQHAITSSQCIVIIWSVFKKKITHTHYAILHEFKLALFQLFNTRIVFSNVITI